MPKPTTKPADKDEIIRRQSDRIEQLEAELRQREEAAPAKANAILEDELDQANVRIADLEDQLAAANEAAAAVSAAGGVQIQAVAGAAPAVGVGLSLPAPYCDDTRIASVIGGRCEIQLRRLDDIRVVNSVFRHLQAERAQYLDGRDTPVPVHRHSHAVLWLIQQLELPGMPQAAAEGSQG